MSFAIGVTLFAVALLLSVAWHECGHMWAAQATGMKVRRYFVGFGPTIWSTRRGETEYGIKALPLGGFCDIAGMTPHEELAWDEKDRAQRRRGPVPRPRRVIPCWPARAGHPIGVRRDWAPGRSSRRRR